MRSCALSANASRPSRNVCIYCLHKLKRAAAFEQAPLIQAQPLRTSKRAQFLDQHRTVTSLSTRQVPSGELHNPPDGRGSVRAGNKTRTQQDGGRSNDWTWGDPARWSGRGSPGNGDRPQHLERKAYQPMTRTQQPQQSGDRSYQSKWSNLPRRLRQDNTQNNAMLQHPNQMPADPTSKPHSRPNWDYREGRTDFVGFQNHNYRSRETWSTKPAGSFTEKPRRGGKQAMGEAVAETPAAFDQDVFGAANADRPVTKWDKKSQYDPAMGDSKAAGALRSGKGKERGRSSRREQKFDQETGLESEVERFAREAKQEKRKEKRAARASPAVSIELPQFITVDNLSTLLRVRQEIFIEKLQELGFSAEESSANYVLSFENASLIAMEFNFEPTTDRSDLEDLKAQPHPEDRSKLPARAPVVTIMGHVDHGKTTLLDYLRKSSVAASEHGGITQHIGAFSVPMPSGSVITFLDTPGHAAFLSMRQRGANVTDIVVLVVAADDSVKPQTIEAIKHAKAANVPIIVAINKIDKEGADIELVKKDLTRHEIVVEDYGGDIQAVPVSGKTGQGLQDLEEALAAQAETIELRTAVDGAAEGWVIEAGTKSNGRVATILVKRGTIRPGDIIVAGTSWARIRTLKNEAGVQVPEAGPGIPVEVDGWRELPTAGDEVLQAPTEQKAASVVDYRQERLDRVKAAADIDAINAARRAEAERREREKLEAEAEAADGQGRSSKGTAETNPLRSQTGKTGLYFMIKADVSGSAEAVEGSVMSLPLGNQPVDISILRTSVGPVNESDIAHVSAVPAGQGFILNFNQTTSPTMMQLAEASGVRILEENIIYNVIDTVRGLVEKHLPPIITQKVLGEAEAAAVFDINIGGRKTMRIVGCKVRNGVIHKGKKVRVSRGGELVYTGTISSLKFHKKDVGEIGKGSDCGMGFEGWEEFEVGDAIQCFEEISEQRRLT